MQSGKLRNRIELQRATTAQDAYGAVAATWATYATVWASLAQPTARQVEQGKSFSDTVNAFIKIRYKTGILPADRVKFGSRYIVIDGIILDPNDDSTETHIYGTERVD